MNLLNMFASLAGNYQSHYLNLADKFAQPSSGGINLNSPTRTQPTPQPNNDAYIPTGQPVAKEASCPNANNLPNQNPVENQQAGDQYTPSPKDSSATEPPATYDLSREARLDISMTLRFDLSAMMRMTESLAEGDVRQVEQFAAAGFGLSSDLEFDGYQTLRTKGEMAGADQSQNGNSVQKLQAADLKFRTFASQSRGFQTEGFYRESSQVRRSLHVNVQGQHRLATNKLALRYRLDSGFKFSFLDRFNVQTKQMSGVDSSQVGSFVDSAGAVAEKGSPEMMSAFFDAVDQYLDQTEQSMSAQTSEKFSMAAEELGFEGELVDKAHDNLVSTVERFFNRVGNAMDQIEANFVPNDPAQMFSGNPFVPSMSQDSSYLTTA